MKSAVGTLVLAAATLAATAACGGNEKKAQAVSAPPAPVTVAGARTETVPVTITAVGNITPFSTVQIKSMVTAPVQAAHFKPGDFVKKGQLLFTLDESTFRADLNRAQGQLSKDQAAAANSQQQAKRYEALFAQGVVARELNEQMQTTAQQAVATLDSDRAAVQAAEINVRYCKIYSPIDGRAGDVLVYPGNVIKAQDVPLVVLNQITPIYVDFSVPEQYLPQIKQYMASGQLKVQTVFPDATQPAGTGKLTFVDNAVDAKTGTIGMKATFENADHKLWPGQFVNTVITLRQLNNAVVVPLSAVQTGQQGPYVYVVGQGNRAELRQVKLGPQVESAQVIEAGVNPGESVVTDGQLRVVPGGALDVKQQGGAPRQTAQQNGQPQGQQGSQAAK